MKVEAKFFTGLAQLTFPTVAADSFPLTSHFQLTGKTHLKASFIRPFVKSIGTVEQAFVEAPDTSLLYSTEELEIDPRDPNGSGLRQLREKLKLVQSLLHDLWLMKDHAVLQETAFLAVKHKNDWLMFSNVWAVRHSKADGTNGPTNFSSEELGLLESKKYPGGFSVLDRNSPTLLTSDSLRFQRFGYFVQSARSAPDVAVKVAQYCTALEAFVSSSQTELSHQIAERIACLFEPAGERRLELFRKIKQAYSVRSKVVHGSSFKGKDDQLLVQSSTLLDEICRKLSQLYISNHDGLAQVLEGPGFDEFWLKKIMFPHEG